MPRQARQKSESGIYHIILRGINKQMLFADDEDRERFISCLHYYKSVSHYALYGYCLMDNHVHLLIKEGKEPIGHTMKRIGVSYVSWHNRKYKRCGHLFQDRFKSETVDTEEYLLTVLRYVHQNPVKAGLANRVEDYQWSSCREYIAGGHLVDSEPILAMLSPERTKAGAAFRKIMLETVDEGCMDAEVTTKRTDQEVLRMIQNAANVRLPVELQNFEKDKRNKILRSIKAQEGVSTWQLARLTGLSQSVIARACAKGIAGDSRASANGKARRLAE